MFVTRFAACIVLTSKLLTVSKSESIIDSNLDLSEPLLPFSHCTIQLIYYDLYQTSEEYKSVPARTNFPSVPIIIAIFRFESIQLISLDNIRLSPASFTCKGVEYHPIPHGFLFTTQHQSHRPCSIQVHLIPCQHWFRDDEEYRWLLYFFPLNFKQAIFREYKSSAREFEISPQNFTDTEEINTDTAKDYTVFKRGIFQALITSYLPVKVPNKSWYIWCIDVTL